MIVKSMQIIVIRALKLYSKLKLVKISIEIWIISYNTFLPTVKYWKNDLIHPYYNQKTCVTLAIILVAYHYDRKECLMTMIGHEKSVFLVLKKNSDIKMKLDLRLLGKSISIYRCQIYQFTKPYFLKPAKNLFKTYYLC